MKKKESSLSMLYKSKESLRAKTNIIRRANRKMTTQNVEIASLRYENAELEHKIRVLEMLRDGWEASVANKTKQAGFTNQTGFDKVWEFILLNPQQSMWNHDRVTWLQNGRNLYRMAFRKFVNSLKHATVGFGVISKFDLVKEVTLEIYNESKTKPTKP